MYHSIGNKIISEVSPNLIVNGDFRWQSIPGFPDGWDRYLAVKSLGTTWWNTPCLEVIDDIPENSGCLKSLKLVVPDDSFVNKVYVTLQGVTYIFDKLHIISRFSPVGRFILSFWAKSSVENTTLKVSWSGKNSYFDLTTEWGFYTVDATFKSSSDLLNMSLSFIPQNTGEFYVTGIQLRKNTIAKIFTPSPFISRIRNIPEPKQRDEFRSYLYEQYGIDYNNIPEINEDPPNKEITIDPRRRCVLINNNPFFFCAACFMRIHLYSEEKWEELFSELSNAGYTSVITTFASRDSVSSRATDEQMINFFDLAQSHNFRIVVWVNPNAVNINGQVYKVKSLPPDDQVGYFEDEIDRLYSVIGSHDALLGWYIYDEPTSEFINSGALDELITYTRQIDSEHLVQVNYSNIWWHYTYLGDIVPVDIASQTSYPIPRRNVQLCAEHITRNYIATGYKKPIALWHQFYAGNGRYPTPNEFTCMVYLAAIYGATGFQTWPIMPNVKLLWDHTRNVINEVKQLEQWLYISQRLDVNISNLYIDGALKQVNDSEYIFVSVNSTNRWQQTIVSFDSIPTIASIYDYFDNSFIPHNGQQVQLVYRPYQRKVLRILC